MLYVFVVCFRDFVPLCYTKVEIILYLHYQDNRVPKEPSVFMFIPYQVVVIMEYFIVTTISLFVNRV